MLGLFVNRERKRSICRVYGNAATDYALLGNLPTIEEAFAREETYAINFAGAAKHNVYGCL